MDRLRSRVPLPPLIACFLLALFGTPTSAAEPESREWTSTAGSRVTATLLKFDATKATLTFSDGTIRPIPILQLSPGDQQYLKQFPELKEEAPPWVTLSARTGSASRSRVAGTTTQRKALDIELSNREQRKAPVKLVWVMLGKDLETKENVVIDFGVWSGSLEPGEAKQIRTPETTTSFTSGGRYYSYYGGYYYYSSYYYADGAEITTFLVQSRWKDKVLESASGSSSARIQEAAASSDLISGLQAAGYQLDSGLIDKINKALQSKPEEATE